VTYSGPQTAALTSALLQRRNHVMMHQLMALRHFRRVCGHNRRLVRRKMRHLHEAAAVESETFRNQLMGQAIT